MNYSFTDNTRYFYRQMGNGEYESNYKQDLVKSSAGTGTDGFNVLEISFPLSWFKDTRECRIFFYGTETGTAAYDGTESLELSTLPVKSTSKPRDGIWLPNP
jgi:hypothetical protein